MGEPHIDPAGSACAVDAAPDAWPLKRPADALAALVALLLLAPLFAVIAMAVRLDSPGPAFFHQIRVGRGGRPFAIHKFRTMRADAQGSGPGVTADGDARITRVGRWLRARRLDELPQLLNVLTGDMSLVGPRPELPRYVAHYPAELARQVLAVRPGLTDPASIEHLDEGERLATSNDPEQTYLKEILPTKLALQADYLRRASFRSDVQVLLLTLRRLFGR